MEVHFQHHSLDENPELRKAINRKIYGQHTLIKWIGFLDFILPNVYFWLLIWVVVTLDNWVDMAELSRYHDNLWFSWVLFCLPFAFVLIMFYAISLRNKWLNQIFLQGSKSLLSGQMVAFLQDNGLYVKGEKAESLFFYQSIQSLEIIEPYLVIIVGHNYLIVIKNDDFTSPENCAEFQKQLQEKMIQAANLQ